VSEEASQVTEHYGNSSLVERVAAALHAEGLAGGVIGIQELASLDQFHARGLQATIDLAAALQPASSDRVLDVGSGLGGPSRYLASTFGCEVQGIDLSPTYVELSGFLAERTGLSDKVTYRRANALSLPFADATFDIAWTQHVAMNIEDRDGLYAEIARVLRPGGRLALYDVVAGSQSPLHFPVPWSRGQETSFLLTVNEMRAVLERRGFKIVSWRDRSPEAIEWFVEFARRQAEGEASSLGLSLAMGDDFPMMSGNLARNIREERAGLLEAIVERI
jgi:ubiquinone/menaquinone biosynthesis C-methylase UbiE